MTLRKRVPDPAKARSMVQAAEKELNYVLTLPVHIDSGCTIVLSLYEDFRLLGSAYLLLQGKETFGDNHHEEMIEALFDLDVKTKRSVRSLAHLKTLRKNVNYNGYIPSLPEVEDTRDLAQNLFQPLVLAIKKRYPKAFLQ